MARALHHARPQIAGEHLDSADHHHDADASQHQQAVTSSRSMAPDGPTITTSVSLNTQAGALERVETLPNALPEPPSARYPRPRCSLMGGIAEGLLAYRRILAAPTSPAKRLLAQVTWPERIPRPLPRFPGMLSEPPGADPHAGWCGRGQGKPGLYPIPREPGAATPPATRPRCASSARRHSSPHELPGARHAPRNTDAPRPAPGMLLPATLTWPALKDRAAATFAPAGSIDRVGAGLTPAPPTPPDVRVRIRRFAWHPGSDGRVLRTLPGLDRPSRRWARRG